jgi:probable H4MPT-linked C1 transfer pathway protein
MTQQASIIGWDIGGAHVKAALLDQTGKALAVIQKTCPLWLGLDQLTASVKAIVAEMPHQAMQHAITMTGELADIFPDRLTGVCEIAQTMQKLLYGDVRYYAGLSGFVYFEQIPAMANNVASANWLASATYLAHEFQQGLFVDFGSTTTDFVILADGVPQIRGFTDATRLQNDELVYTGMIRTPLMAIARHIDFAGERCGVAAEHFATTADVYRLLGHLNETDDMSSTADGADKSIEATARRIARMIGRDLAEANMHTWKQLAWAFHDQQFSLMHTAALRHISRNQISADAPIIGAGVGRHLLKKLASRLNRQYYDVQQIISADTEITQHWAGVCFPAYAVAYLAVK